MPPSRPRPPPDDSRSEASSTREKAVNASSNASGNGNGNGNGKRRFAGNAGAGSSLRDVLTASQSSAVAPGSAGANPDANPGIKWTSLDPSILHGYRYDYRLSTPAAFNKASNEAILTQSPIGRMSPTMARHKQQRRQSKEQLATTVRKHFNSFAVAENEVVVDFLYKVRWQDKNFRMRFVPQRPR